MTTPTPEFFGRPAFTLAGTEHGWRPLATGWSLGGLSPEDRDRLVRFVLADPRRGDTGRELGPALPLPWAAGVPAKVQADPS